MAQSALQPTKHNISCGTLHTAWYLKSFIATWLLGIVFYSLQKMDGWILFNLRAFI